MRDHVVSRGRFAPVARAAAHHSSTLRKLVLNKRPLPAGGAGRCASFVNTAQACVEQAAASRRWRGPLRIIRQHCASLC